MIYKNKFESRNIFLQTDQPSSLLSNFSVYDKKMAKKKAVLYFRLALKEKKRRLKAQSLKKEIFLKEKTGLSFKNPLEKQEVSNPPFLYSRSPEFYSWAALKKSSFKSFLGYTSYRDLFIKSS